MKGFCEDCKKYDSCEKAIGNMFGYCSTDFEPIEDNKVKPLSQPCVVCKNHKSGVPFILRDDNGVEYKFSHICNCPFCGRFLAENY